MARPITEQEAQELAERIWLELEHAKTKAQEIEILRRYIEQAVAVPEWRPIESVPPQGTVILGYSADWVDKDFNPDGIRECWPTFCDDVVENWTSAKWFDHQDCYVSDTESAPTHWMPLPGAPKQETDHD